MSSFEIKGTVVKVERKTSTKGNEYAVFQLKDTAGKIFEMSLFGDTMSFLDKVENGRVVEIKGILTSREYVDKNNVTRYGMGLTPSWIDVVKTDGGKKYDSSKAAETNDDLGDIPF